MVFSDIKLVVLFLQYVPVPTRSKVVWEQIFHATPKVGNKTSPGQFMFFIRFGPKFTFLMFRKTIPVR